MRPLRRSRMPPRHACTVRNAPVRFTSMSRCHCSAVIRWAGAIVVVMPALATHTSMSSSGGNWIARDVERDVAARSQVERSPPPARRRPGAAAIAAPIPRAAPVTSALRASGHNGPPPIIEGGNDDRPLVLRGGARAALAADDGPRDRGDRRGRPRRGAPPVRRDEARVADAPRPDGRRACSTSSPSSSSGSATRASPKPGTESMGRGWRRHHDAIVALDRRELVGLLAATWRAHSCSGVGPEPRQLHDHRGRGEGHVRDEPVRLRPAARAATAPTRACPTAAARARRTTGPSAARASRSTAPTAAS